MKKYIIFSAFISIFITSAKADYTPSGTRTPEIRSSIIGEPKDHLNPIPTTKNESSDKIGIDSKRRSFETNRETYEEARRKARDERHRDYQNRIHQNFKY